MNKHHSFRLYGQSMVELALLLPALLLIVFLTIDLGRGIYYYSAVFNAAREGSRYGIIQPDDYVGINNAARKLTIGLDQSQICVDTYTISDGQQIKVSVSYIFQLITSQMITPLVNLIHPGNIDLADPEDTPICCGQNLQPGQFCLHSISEMYIER
jgi:hypothetical protein